MAIDLSDLEKSCRQFPWRAEKDAEPIIVQFARQVAAAAFEEAATCIEWDHRHNGGIRAIQADIRRRAAELGLTAAEADEGGDAS